MPFYYRIDYFICVILALLHKIYFCKKLDFDDFLKDETELKCPQSGWERGIVAECAAGIEEGQA